MLLVSNTIGSAGNGERSDSVMITIVLEFEENVWPEMEALNVAVNLEDQCKATS